MEILFCFEAIAPQFLSAPRAGLSSPAKNCGYIKFMADPQLKTKIHTEAGVICHFTTEIKGAVDKWTSSSLCARVA